jgi:hypothetical protein
MTCQKRVIAELFGGLIHQLFFTQKATKNTKTDFEQEVAKEAKRVEKGVSQEWREVKRGLGWFSTLSANWSWDRLKEEGLTDIAHLGQEQFEFSVLSNGLLKEFSLLGR